MSGGRVLDAAAIIDIIAGKTFYGRALFRVAVEARLTLCLPAVALQVAWQQVAENHRPFLDLFVDSERVTVEPLDADTARGGGMVASSRGYPEAPAEIVHAVHVARARGWALVTGNPDVVLALDPHVPFESLP